MDYYNLKLRLHGDVRHEVLKKDMSAPEVVVLRAVHGDDAIVNLEYSKTADVDDAAERERLHMRYGGALNKLEPKTNIQHMFGGDHMPLLDTLKGVAKPNKKVVAAPKKQEESDEDDETENEKENAGVEIHRPAPKKVAAAGGSARRKPVGAVV